MKLARLTGLAMALLAFSVFAGDLEEGVHAFNSKNYESAAKFFRNAAEQGDAQAQLKLGMLYATGRGVSLDDQQAVSWYQKAAEKKNAEGQFYLGVRYANGNGIAIDYVEAVKWLILSGKAGFEIASLFREFLEKNMTPANIAEARERANAWMKAHP